MSDHIKVAFLCSGGVIRSIKWYERNLATRLVKLGFKVKAYTSKDILRIFPQEKPRDFIDGIEVVRYDGWISIKPRLKIGDFIRLIHDITLFKPNIIHVHFPSYMNPNAWIALFMKYVFKTPYIITLHNILLDPYIKASLPHTWDAKYDISEVISTAKDLFLRTLAKGKFPKNKDLVNYLSHAEILHANKVIALTSFEKHILTEYLGVPKERIVVIPNAIDENILKHNIPKEVAREKLGLPKDKHIILFLAQMIEIKGPQYLIEALKDVFNEIPNAIAIFAGYNTKLASYLIKRAKELSIKDKVMIYWQYLEEEEKYLLLNAADVYVLPTLSEGFPTSVLEAMAFGKPVVVSNVTGISDIIDHMEVGILVKPTDSKDIASALIKLLMNNKLRAELSEKARMKILEKFTWARITNEYVKIYLDILNV